MGEAIERQFLHIHFPCCSEHDDGDNINYYATIEEAEKYAVRGDVIAQIVKEIK